MYVTYYYRHGYSKKLYLMSCPYYEGIGSISLNLEKVFEIEAGRKKHIMFTKRIIKFIKSLKDFQNDIIVENWLKTNAYLWLEDFIK